MPQTSSSGNVHSSLRVGPELPDAQRRATAWIGVIAGVTAAVPVGMLALGYADRWQPAFFQALVCFVFATFIAAWHICRIVRNLRKDEIVRIGFTPDSLILFKRYSCAEIDYPRLAGMRLVYRPVTGGNGVTQYVTHRRMRLILYGAHRHGELYRLDDGLFGEKLAVLNGGFSLLSRAAGEIRDRVEAIGGYRIEYDEQADRQSRLFQKQIRMIPPSVGIFFGCLTLVLTVWMIWIALDRPQDIVGLEVAVAVPILALCWGVAACCYFGAKPAVVNGRLVLVGKDELAEDYF